MLKLIEQILFINMAIDAEWKKQSVYIKELDSWVETSNIKYKVNDSWQDVEVYK